VSGYKHHVIISYRRLDQWEDWVRNLFAPTLRKHLGLEFPDAVSVYVDDQINTGADWEYSLIAAVNCSRTMVPIFTNPYFASEQCCKELARMLHREEFLGLRCEERPDGLIFLVRLSSRHYFPDHACRIQDGDFTDFAITSLAPNTITHERFDEKIRLFATNLATAIRTSSDYDPAWEKLDGAHLLSILAPKELDIRQPPRIGS
jgi:hypothetical protein